jgi:hypothetical protein
VTNYVKQTWTDGSSALSAARMGLIENGVFDAHFQPTARVTHSANQSITTATLTALAFDTERFDTDTIHDTVTNNSRLTCKTAGKYQIIGGIRWGLSSAGTVRIVSIRLNGTTEIGRPGQAPGAAINQEQIAVTIWDMAVNDYVELTVYHDVGSSINVEKQAAWSPEFMMVRVA